MNSLFPLGGRAECYIDIPELHSIDLAIALDEDSILAFCIYILEKNIPDGSGFCVLIPVHR